MYKYKSVLQVSYFSFCWLTYFRSPNETDIHIISIRWVAWFIYTRFPLISENNSASTHSTYDTDSETMERCVQTLRLIPNATLHTPLTPLTAHSTTLSTLWSDALSGLSSVRGLCRGYYVLTVKGIPIHSRAPSVSLSLCASVRMSFVDNCLCHIFVHKTIYDA